MTLSIRGTVVWNTRETRNIYSQVPILPRCRRFRSTTSTIKTCFSAPSATRPYKKASSHDAVENAPFSFIWHLRLQSTMKTQTRAISQRMRPKSQRQTLVTAFLYGKRQRQQSVACVRRLRCQILTRALMERRKSFYVIGCRWKTTRFKSCRKIFKSSKNSPGIFQFIFVSDLAELLWFCSECNAHNQST